MIDALNAVLIPQLENDATLQGLAFLNAYAVRVPQGTPYNYTLLWQPPSNDQYGDTPVETFGRVAVQTTAFLVDFVTDSANDDPIKAADARVKALWFRAQPTVSGYRVIGARYGLTKWTGRALRNGTQVRVASTPWTWTLVPL